MTHSLEDCVVQLVVESRLRVVSKCSEGHWHKRKTIKVYVVRDGQLLEILTHNLEQPQSKHG